MLFYFISRLVTTFAFLHGAYASFKAIKGNDLQLLETLLIYWIVMALVVAVESTVEWSFNWFPFYYHVKTLALIWLTLPQIQGSSYVYLAHIEPFLTKHEVEIDKAIANARIRAKEVGLDYLNRAIQILRTTVVGTLAPQLFRQSNEDGHDPNQIPPPHLMNQPPSLADPASGAAAQLFSLAGNVFRQYGPAAVAAGSALLHPMKGRAPSVRRVDPHQQQQSDIGLGNASGYDVTTSSRAPSSTKPGVRSRREPSATESVSTVSSPGSYASSSHPSSPQYQPPQRQQAMGSRSVSAGQVPSFGMSASSSSHTISGAAAHASGPSRIHSSSAISSLAQQQQQSSSSTRDGHQSASNSSTSSSNGGGGGHGFEQIRREELGDYAERPNTTRSRVSSSSQGNGGASGAAAGESPAKKGWFS